MNGPLHKRPVTISGIEEFVGSAVCLDPKAECRLAIRDYFVLYDVLVEDLDKMLRSHFLVEETFVARFSAVCPKCGKMIDGPTLWAIGLTVACSEHPLSVVARKNPIFIRFAQGVCPNSECSSEELIFSWRGIVISKGNENE